jgi:5'-3' exonuclease
MSEISVNDLVAAYRKLRKAIADEEEAYEAKVNSLKEKLELVSNELLSMCNEQNIDSIKTPSGTVSRRVQTRYWSSDWDQMYKFIQEHNAVFLLEKRVHNTNMKQFLEENPDVLPIGLQVDNKYVIQVRKPTEK